MKDRRRQTEASRRRRNPGQTRLGDATLVAAVTVVAYLSALAYRVGETLRFGFPVTLAVVRLSDAALAGLLVLLIAVLSFVFYDLAESRQPGLVERISAAILAILAFIVLMDLSIILAVYGLIRWGWFAALVITFVGFGLGIWLGVAIVRATPRLGHGSAPGTKMPMLEALLRRYPFQTLGVLTATLLCLSAGVFGVSGFPQHRYLRSKSSDEIAVMLYDDRAVLAGFAQENSKSVEATLTGSLRVVPLSSDDLVLVSTPIARLNK